MENAQSGYWDFYQDDAGYWHWRFACIEFKRVIASAKRHATSDECLSDAMKHGYSRASEHRVTRSIDT